MQHDIEYSKHSSDRYEADKILESQAIQRLKAKDASFGERLAALAVAGGMKVKQAFTSNKKTGSGLKISKKMCKKKLCFAKLVKAAQATVKRSKSKNLESLVNSAIVSAKKARGVNKVKSPRIIQLPKRITGGILPIVPILAGLAATGSIVSSITNVIQKAKAIANATKNSEETAQRKVGNGLYLMNGRKTGRGLYLKRSPKNY